MLAQMSILSLRAMNDDLFSDMALPDELDRDLCFDAITLECAELNVVYTDPEVMQLMIQIWSRTRLRSWQMMTDAVLQDYNPLYNRESNIREERKINRDGNNVNSVQGFNSASFSDAMKNTYTDGTSEVFERTDAGNIGVTTSQEMLQAEIDVRKNDIYHIIAQEFKQRFCVMVY